MAAPEINREKNGETLKELLSIERNPKVPQMDAVDDADGEVDIAMAAAAVVDTAGDAGN